MKTFFLFLELCVFFTLGCEKSNDDDNDPTPANNLPSLATTEVTAISSNTANSGGNITSDGGFSVTSRGVCWGVSQNPTINDNKTTDGDGIGVFTSNVTGLNANSTYYIRSYATNINGTGYGNCLSFTTLDEVNGVVDIEGNEYLTVVIGSQEWMAENLKTTKYKNGDDIENISTDNTAWQNNTSGAFSWYLNDTVYKDIYGAIYNWAVVNTGNLCPSGWHVPTSEEWVQLVAYVTANGHANNEANALKATTGWPYEGNGTDNFGFKALPSGYRDEDGEFHGGGVGYWWTSNELNSVYALVRQMYHGSEIVGGNPIEKTMGSTVRCLKN